MDKTKERLERWCSPTNIKFNNAGSVVDEAKHENIKAMFEFTKEYGGYK
jgi:hypothetical protein